MGRLGRALARGFKKFAKFTTNVNKKVYNGLKKVPVLGKVVEKIPLMNKIPQAAEKINNKVNDWASK